MMSGCPREVLTVEVKRADLRQCRVISEQLPVPSPGEVLLEVDRFAISANNITYARLGEVFGYWSCFPAASGWGRIPVWGHATVVASNHEDIVAGSRVFGFLPMSTHLVVAPTRVRPGRFTDGAAHRSGLPPAYNAYRTMAAPARIDDESRVALLSPVFMLSFLLDDHLRTLTEVDAPSVVVSSASSKAAIGTAFLLRERGISVCGLTAGEHTEFVESLGIFTTVLDYGNVQSIPTRPSVFVDIAGNERLRHEVTKAVGQNLAGVVVAGRSHPDDTDPRDVHAAGDGTMFSAPTRIVERTREWGRDEFDRRVTASLQRFAEWSSAWLQLVYVDGPIASTAAYEQTQRGATSPADGLILSVLDDDHRSGFLASVIPPIRPTIGGPHG